jgi:hypothetical protein
LLRFGICFINRAIKVRDESGKQRAKQFAIGFRPAFGDFFYLGDAFIHSGMESGSAGVGYLNPLHSAVVIIGGFCDEFAVHQGVDVPAHSGRVELQEVGEIGRAHRTFKRQFAQHRAHGGLLMLAWTNALGSHQELDHSDGDLGVGGIASSLRKQRASSLKLGGSWLQHATILDEVQSAAKRGGLNGQNTCGIFVEIYDFNGSLRTHAANQALRPETT